MLVDVVVVVVMSDVEVSVDVVAVSVEVSVDVDVSVEVSDDDEAAEDDISVDDISVVVVVVVAADVGVDATSVDVSVVVVVKTLDDGLEEDDEDSPLEEVTDGFGDAVDDAALLEDDIFSELAGVMVEVRVVVDVWVVVVTEGPTVTVSPPLPPPALPPVAVDRTSVTVVVAVMSGVRKSGGILKANGWPLKNPDTGMPPTPMYTPSQLPSALKPRFARCWRGLTVVYDVAVVKLSRLMV